MVRSVHESRRQPHSKGPGFDHLPAVHVLHVLENPAMVIEMMSRSTSAGEVKVVEEDED